MPDLADPPLLLRLLLALLAAVVAGAMNSIAGGGTLLTFPAIIGLGVQPLVANATSTVALWPGIVASMWGYRSELAGARTWVLRFTAPSLVGGAFGAWLLLRTPPERFARLAPFLVLGATLLFLVQGPLMRRLRARRDVVEGACAGGRDARAARIAGAHPTTHPRWSFLGLQALAGVYGGYFGAGVGILMLAVLGLMGLTNIHRMNGLKNWGGACMNVVAVAMFAASGIVNWPIALTMAVGGMLGGYGASRIAQRVGQTPVRRAIVVIGLGSFIWLLLRPM